MLVGTGKKISKEELLRQRMEKIKNQKTKLVQKKLSKYEKVHLGELKDIMQDTDM